MNKVYLAWQEGLKAIERIDELLREPRTLLIDVRLNAWSVRPDFQHTQLSSRYKGRYRREGWCLGNTAKWGTNLVRIANPARGLADLMRYLNEGHDLILLYYDEQHVKEICRLLVGVRPEVEVVKFVQPVVSIGEK